MAAVVSMVRTPASFIASVNSPWRCVPSFPKKSLPPATARRAAFATLSLTPTSAPNVRRASARAVTPPIRTKAERVRCEQLTSLATLPTNFVTTSAHSPTLSTLSSPLLIRSMADLTASVIDCTTTRLATSLSHTFTPFTLNRWECTTEDRASNTPMSNTANSAGTPVKLHPPLLSFPFSSLLSLCCTSSTPAFTSDMMQVDSRLRAVMSVFVTEEVTGVCARHPTPTL
mmetsp:Transcript_33984/g.87256  ORF Transcript_33984/g.87256 Transcript_33984/m.87256 type:complete len:229 (+) Transcript_33984:207-893(+)